MKGATALPEPEAAPDPAPVAPYDKEQLTPVGPRPGTTTVITSAPSTTARVVVTPPPATTTTAADSGDWLEAGQAEAARGNWAGAAKAYAKASAQAPEDRKILARLGEAQLNSGDAAGAESSLSRAGSGGVECLLGDARKALGDDAGANAAWTNCLKADPSKAGTYQAKLDGGG
jgi:tetratricopeptide (TPR) repeat protein